MDKRSGVDFPLVPLTWFGEDGDPPASTGEGGDGPKGDDDAVSKALEAKIQKAVAKYTKDLDTARKESAGKDKKIDQLQAEVDKLRQSSLSREELANLKLKEAEEKLGAAEKVEEEADERIRKAEAKWLRYDTLRNIKGFPMEHADFIQGETPDQIELNAKKFMQIILGERDKVENFRKAAAPPQAGTKTTGAMSPERWRSMTLEQKQQYLVTASEEETDAVVRGDYD